MNFRDIFLKLRPSQDLKEIHVVGAAIMNCSECLVACRSSSMTFPGCWEFPGGKMQPGETPHQALAREIREELSLEIEVGPLLGRGEWKGDGLYIKLDVYEATVNSGEVQLVEHAAFGWFDADLIDSLKWAPADIPVLEKLKNRLKSL